MASSEASTAAAAAATATDTATATATVECFCFRSVSRKRKVRKREVSICFRNVLRKRKVRKRKVSICFRNVLRKVSICFRNVLRKRKVSLKKSTTTTTAAECCPNCFGKGKVSLKKSTTTTTAECCPNCLAKCSPNCFGERRVTFGSDYFSSAGITHRQFTCTAWQALVSSRDVAKKNQHQMLETEHLMRALLEQKNSLACIIFSKVGLVSARLRVATDKYMESQPKALGQFAGPMIGRDLKALIKRAKNYKKECGQSFVSVVHLVLGFAQDQRFGKQLFKNLQVPMRNLKSAIESCPSLIGRDPEGKYEALEKYGKDLTALAMAGMLDPVAGRDSEIRKCMRILSTVIRNNVALIGDPSVGKTSISEGLAQMIVQRDLPPRLMNSKLIYFDMGTLIAGPEYLREFEERLEAMLKEVTGSDCQIILFIDINTADGAGARSGAADVTNLLKLIFRWGKFQGIVTMTPDDYHRYIEKDPTLKRCFQQVHVDPPTVEDTISILRGLCERYELHLGVRISDSALVQAAVLSDRCINGKFLPDKAIDLVDEAVAKAQMEMTSKPTAIDQMNESVSELEKERISLTNVTDKVSRDRLSYLDAELAPLKGKLARLNEQWEYEKSLMTRIQSIKGEINRVNSEFQRAKREHGFNHAAELKCGSLNFLQCQLATAEEELVEYVRSGKLILKEVTGNDIAEIVSSWTSIPVSKLKQSEREKLLHLEEELNKHVMGQEFAVRSVVAAIRRAWVGLSARGRPIASFMLMGPSGVGKTELAKALASYYFDTEEAFVQINMSEYMEEHAVSKLIGASPDYVDYEEGHLTEIVSKRPYVVIVFDEIEKAHIDVLNALIQILNEGRVVDSLRRIVRFTSTIIMMTSNVGSEYILDTNDDIQKSTYEIVRLKMMHAARSVFSRRFTDSVDEFIVFHSLSRHQISIVVKLQLESIQDRIADRKMKLRVTDAAVELIESIGYDANYGVGHIKLLIEQDIEKELFNGILLGDFKDEDTILVDTELQKLVIRKLVSS